MLQCIEYTFCKSEYTVLSKGYKESQFYKFTVIVAKSHTLINCTCKNRLGFSLLALLWYHSILRGSIDQKHAKMNEIWRQNSEIHSAFACFHRPPWLPDPFKPYGACVKRGSGKHLSVPVFSSESAVKYLRVGRRKIQISPPPGEQDKSNALPQGQQRQSNPHPMPCPPPSGFTLIGALPTSRDLPCSR